MTDAHLGSRACYQRGCRQRECRLANTVYEKLVVAFGDLLVLSNPHQGSRACYKRGCREIECRVANAVYQKLRKVKQKQGIPAQGAIVNGHQASVILRNLTNEGYRKGQLARLLRIGRNTFWRHLRSAPAERGTMERVRAFWRETQMQSDATLDRGRCRVVSDMLDSLGRDYRSHGASWHTSIREEDHNV